MRPQTFTLSQDERRALTLLEIGQKYPAELAAALWPPQTVQGLTGPALAPKSPEQTVAAHRDVRAILQRLQRLGLALLASDKWGVTPRGRQYALQMDVVPGE